MVDNVANQRSKYMANHRIVNYNEGADYREGDLVMMPDGNAVTYRSVHVGEEDETEVIDVQCVGSQEDGYSVSAG